MVRAPCCEKMGLKKGPWTPEEDQIMIAYIQRYGHGNWRALPKQAGLLRCGKSCRLRWTNYLRPDIKRGNFSREEEEAIINLHEMLGNRWSAIAAKLPGRTDNEIKNVWHTHLKKRLKQQNDEDAAPETETSKCDQSNMTADLETTNSLHDDQPKTETTTTYVPVSPQQSSSDLSGTDSSVVTGENHDMITTDSYSISESSLLEIDNFLWDFPLPTLDPQLQSTSSFKGSSNVDDNGMDFWYDLFMKADGVPELPDEP